MKRVWLVSCRAGEVELGRKAINDAFEEVVRLEGRIIKTEYLKDNNGRLITVVIEYEI